MKIIVQNKKARFDYHILDTIEAGIVLTGDEIKSIRNGHVSIEEAFAVLQGANMSLLNAFIAPYSHAYDKSDKSRKSRRLLLHRKEIDRLAGDIARKGITVVPLKMYFGSRGYVKVELGLAKHKNAVDKRNDIKERDLKREASRELSGKW